MACKLLTFYAGGLDPYTAAHIDLENCITTSVNVWVSGSTFK